MKRRSIALIALFLAVALAVGVGIVNINEAAKTRAEQLLTLSEDLTAEKVFEALEYEQPVSNGALYDNFRCRNATAENVGYPHLAVIQYTDGSFDGTLTCRIDLGTFLRSDCVKVNDGIIVGKNDVNSSEGWDGETFAPYDQCE